MGFKKIYISENLVSLIFYYEETKIMFFINWSKQNVFCIQQCKSHIQWQPKIQRPHSKIYLFKADLKQIPNAKLQCPYIVYAEILEGKISQSISDSTSEVAPVLHI